MMELFIDDISVLGWLPLDDWKDLFQLREFISRYLDG